MTLAEKIGVSWRATKLKDRDSEVYYPDVVAKWERLYIILFVVIISTTITTWLLKREMTRRMESGLGRKVA